MRPFPISPALSACDSLADIDDLYAFLEAQGELSRFPTPPQPRNDFVVAEMEIDLGEQDDRLDHAHVAKLFAGEASVGAAPTQVEIDLIQQMLLRARIPPEVLALAYNILTALDCRSLPEGCFYAAPSDLVAVSALSLAVSYTSDRPVDPSFWSKHVCDCMWTAIRIDKTALLILAALDWRIHPLTSPLALEKAMADLRRPVVPLDFVVARDRRDSVQGAQEQCFEPASDLKLMIDGTSASWFNGQLTPDGSPASTEFGRTKNRRIAEVDES